MLQPTPDGKAIWRATISSEGGWSHSFTLLRLAPALIWETAQRPEPFAGSVTIETASDSEDAQLMPPREGNPLPDAMEDLLTMIAVAPDAGQHSDALATDSTPPEPSTLPAPVPSPSVPRVTGSDPVTVTTQPSGEHFMLWLKQAIVSRRLIINDAKALVHTVADTAYLVSPGVFQRYAQEHPQVSALAKEEKQQDWQWVQKRFEKLGLHRKQADGLNIWTCEVTGPRKSRKLHGYLLLQPQLVFGDVLPNNPYLSLV